jgi:hypothetical protein
MEKRIKNGVRKRTIIEKEYFIYSYQGLNEKRMNHYNFI